MCIVAAGDTDGWIVPCGCASNQSGGLPRRAAFLERRRSLGPVVAVDVGGAAGGTTLYDRLKFDAILQGESAMGVAVHNIGRTEAMLGADELRRLRETRAVPWISANTSDAEGSPLAEPARIVEAGKKKILFIGVLSRDFRIENIRVSPPKQAILKCLKDNAGRYDHAVVLAYVPEDELLELAENLPEVDAVLGGPTGQPVPPEYPRGTVLAISATKQGKFLAALTLENNGGKPAMFRGEIVELDERFADDPVQAENVRKFYDELAGRDLAPADTPFAGFLPPSPDSVAGAKTCGNCHEKEYATWKVSGHANAWQSLVEKGAQYDPDCQRCHVIGYGQRGGFETASRSADRTGVSCESCHGPSTRHCTNTSVRTLPAEQRQQRCLNCHDRENSPRFDYDEYWTKIRHGADFVDADR